MKAPKFSPFNPELWLLVLRTIRSAGRDFFKDNGPSWSAAIAYYGLLSIFPLLLAVGSVAAFFVDAEWAIKQATDTLGALLPRGPDAIDRVVEQTLEAARGRGLLTLIPLLWTGSLVFGAISKALNVIFETEEQGGFWKRMGVRMAMLVVLALMFLVALCSPLVLQTLRWSFGIFPIGQEALFQIVVNALPPISVLVTFFLAYRYVPQRPPDWRPALGGATLASLLFAAAKPIFLGYLQWLARYSIVYGSLAGIIVVVFWTWIVAMIGLFGAQVAAHAQLVFTKRGDARETPVRKASEPEDGDEWS